MLGEVERRHIGAEEPGELAFVAEHQMTHLGMHAVRAEHEREVVFAAVIERDVDGVGRLLDLGDLHAEFDLDAQTLGVEIKFGVEITQIEETADAVHVTFDDGGEDDFALVFGADGVHSQVRHLVFGDERQFARFLGAYVAAFHLTEHSFPVGRAIKLHEDVDRVAAYYPLDDKRLDATYVFRHDETYVPREERLALVRKAYKGSGWIGEPM